ncbi:MAG TPA: hypothetical protein VG734_24625 [Lacunisphaera sp.]|nr:hypothetical protein [Lacunisphaera sp.]
MSRRRDFYAAKLSLARVLGDEGWCYLWTFTTPDVVDPKTLSGRWTRFRNHRTMKALKLKALRVIEQHPGGHGFHMHFVTPQRLDAETIWSVAKGVGLGRIDVQRIPASRAAYVLKYLRKDRHKGCRAWAVLGVKGVTCKSIVIQDTFSRRVFDAMPNVSGYSSFTNYVFGLKYVLDGLCKPPGWDPCLGVFLNAYAKYLPKGVLLFGEYRGRRLDTVEISVQGGLEKMTYQVVRDLVVVRERSGMVRRQLQPGEELSLPPAPVCKVGRPCIVVARWSSMRGFTFDSFGHVEPLPDVPGTPLDGCIELSDYARVQAELATIGWGITAQELAAMAVSSCAIPERS